MDLDQSELKSSEIMLVLFQEDMTELKCMEFINYTPDLRGGGGIAYSTSVNNAQTKQTLKF